MNKTLKKSSIAIGSVVLIGIGIGLYVYRTNTASVDTNLSERETSYILQGQQSVSTAPTPTKDTDHLKDRSSYVVMSQMEDATQEKAQPPKLEEDRWREDLEVVRSKLRIRQAKPSAVAVQEPTGERRWTVDESAHIALTPLEFIEALLNATASSDLSAIYNLLEQIEGHVEYVAPLQELMGDANVDDQLRRHIAEALIKIGTQASVNYVLTQLLTVQREGDSDQAGILLSALETPTTIEGARVMLNLLLGRESFVEYRDDVPEGIRDAVQKALRIASDQEAVGLMAANIYMEARLDEDVSAQREILEGVSHPAMYAELAVLSNRADLQEEARQFLSYLSESDNQQTIRAVVEIAAQEESLLPELAPLLYDWSLDNPNVANEGLFLEYIADVNRSPAQRIIAACGLAGVANRDAAQEILAKAISEENDVYIRDGLQMALDIVERKDQSE